MGPIIANDYKFFVLLHAEHINLLQPKFDSSNPQKKYILYNLFYTYTIITYPISYKESGSWVKVC